MVEEGRQARFETPAGYVSGVQRLWQSGPTTWRERLAARWPERWWPDPVKTVDVLQAAKTALAGVLAWVIATDVLGLEQAFLAPWAAVLVVHATVYRTVSRGGQQIAATFLGVLLAWASGQLFGMGALGMGVMLAAAYLVGQHRWLRDESTTIATTGIVVLATYAIDQENLLLGRLLDTTVGIVVGLAVNLLVWPPLRDRAVWASLDRLPLDLAAVLAEMASGLGPDLESSDVEGWVGRCRQIDEGIDEAWALLGQAKESGRFNPRRSRPLGLDDQVRTLHLLEQAVADTMSTARTVATSADSSTVWEDDFRTRWTQVLAATATAVEAHDEKRLRELRDDLSELARAMSTESLPGSTWTEYGGLLVNLRNVVAALTEVVESGHRSGPGRRRSKRYRAPTDVLREGRARTRGDP